MNKKILIPIQAFLLIGTCSVVRSFGFDPSAFNNPSWNIVYPGSITETLASVEGNENAKEDLVDIVNFLKNSTAYTEIGAVVPKGVILHGPPGTGKTLLARAVAGEANCPFISASGSQFVEMYVGTGAARIRSLFDAARSLECPCIIFIDEIDALIKKRGSDIHTPEGDMTLNEFLRQMDGFEQHQYPIIVIGATNRIDTADSAALRPGRFDRQVYVGLPTQIEREKILALHMRKRKYVQNIDLKKIASLTSGLSGAYLANLINEAAIMAINKNKKRIDQTDLEAALDKTFMGKPNKNMIITAEEKRLVAYHEAGHALVHILLNGNKSRIYKVSIISRGSFGGVTAFLNQENHSYNKQEFLDHIMTLFGGMVAEKIIFDVITTGPESDMERATGLARTMVCKHGMSEKIGRVAYQYNPERAIAPYAQSTLTAIDEEVRIILDDCYQRALELLSANKKALDAIAQALLEKEEISAQEVYALAKK